MQTSKRMSLPLRLRGWVVMDLYMVVGEDSSQRVGGRVIREEGCS